MSLQHYYHDDYAEIIRGDALQSLKLLEDESINMCVTSPPYWGLRQYLFDGAMVLRSDLTIKEMEYVESELRKRNIEPR